jgi:hypothetical protein
MQYRDVILGTANLAGYWRLDDASGTSAADLGPNAITLTYANTPTLGAQGLLDGDANTAVEFNGTNEYALGATHASLQGGSAVTLECWVNIDAAGNRCAVGLFGSATDKGYWINLSNPFAFYMSNDGTAQFAATAVTATATSTRYHIVGTYDGADSKIYVNGVLEGTNSSPTGAIRTVVTASAFAIGRLGALNSDFADGRVDEVAVYNRVLSATEIAGHYLMGITGPYGPPHKASAPTDLIIAGPGFYNQRLVPISPPDMSWRTDGPGSFSCEIDTRELTNVGINVSASDDPLQGMWVWWEHPTAGAWGGVITRTEVDTWYTRVTAEQFNVLLRKRRMSSTFGQMSASPGALALMFLTAAERNGDSFGLTSWTAEETGPAIDIEPRGGDLCDDVLRSLTRFGYQWRVKADTMDERAFQFRRRLGYDLSRSVLLSEGMDIPHGGFRVSADLWTVANSIVGISGQSDWRDSNGYQADDDGSIRALGRRYEDVIGYNGATSRSTLVPLVKADLAEMSYPKHIAEIVVTEQNNTWQTFREGDTVAVSSAAANVYAPFEVDIRSLNMTTGLMTLAGKLRTEDTYST